MSKFRMPVAYARFDPFRSRSFALVLCYAIGLVATRQIGVGFSGYPLLSIAAPAAVGMLVRMGERLDPLDLLRLYAVHLAVALMFGTAAEAALWGGACDLVAVVAGVMAFRMVRRRGAVASPVGLMTALLVVALVSSAASVGVEAWRMVLDGAVDGLGLIALLLANLVSMALMLSISVTLGRDRASSSIAVSLAEEREPQAREYVAAAVVVAGFVVLAIVTGWPVAALAASVMLLWFALRLGLFATTVAAFAFAVAFLVHGAEAPWPQALAPSASALGDIARYVVLALLATPSIVVATVVFEQQRLRRMFAYRATHDGLTKLTNRARFLELLDAYCLSAKPKGERFLLLLVDLDHFKAVNDTFGHARGDRMLVAVSSRILGSFRATDVVARIGGDEFAVIAPISAVDDAMRLAKRLVDNVHEECDFDGLLLRPSVTVGGVIAPDSADRPERLLLLADEALYRAKAAGRNCWRFSGDEAVRPAPAMLPWAPSPGDGEADLETVFVD